MKKIKGFTLVELVIVIAIVVILSVISVPIYRGYTTKAKYSEGYALLGVILSAQKSYYSEYGVFLNTTRGSAGQNLFTCNEEVLGIDARGNKYFTSFSIAAYNNANNHYFHAEVVKPESIRQDKSKSLLSLYYCATSNGGATFRDNINWSES